MFIKETIAIFLHFLIVVAFRKKNHVPITWEPGLVSLVLHASFTIHSMLLLEHIPWLDLLPQQLSLRQVCHMLEGFLHGQQYLECHIYLGKVFNLMCLLLCLLHKALYPCRAGTTTWLVKDVDCPVYLYICFGLCLHSVLFCRWIRPVW